MVSGLRIHCFAQLWIDWPQGWNTMLHSQPNVGFLPKNDLPNNFFYQTSSDLSKLGQNPHKVYFLLQKIRFRSFRFKGSNSYYYHLNIWKSLFSEIGPHFCRLYIHTQVNSSPVKNVLYYINFFSKNLYNSIGCATLCSKIKWGHVKTLC